MSFENNISDSDIAVVGMSCHFPDARNYSEFWENLTIGKESVTYFSEEELIKAGVEEDEVKNPNYVKAGVTLQDVDLFDAGFFGLSPKEASIMDPQHRHFLEAAWEALEDAGYVPEKFDGPIGVFGGCGMNSYFMFNILTNPDLVKSTGLFLLRHTGNDKDFLTTRVSYNFNLTGPSVSVQTACSTSLVAIHLGVQSLLSGECDMALAGGVTIELPQKKGYLFEEGEILSSDGKCRPFDSKSNGTIFGSGVGVVVLRRLEEAINDGDNIHAVIKSTAINNDGSLKVGYFAPSVEGQAQVIAEAIALANVTPESISYIETHGTGTFIGDPIEVTALNTAFKRFTKKKNFCGIGSVKGNIGHLDTAAGVAGFVKTVLALKNQKIPANINFQKPNPNLDLENSPFYINSRLSNWEISDNPRRAGVSSLGVGGTNAHIILQEAPVQTSSGDSDPYHLLIWSARNQTSLENVIDKFRAYFNTNNSLYASDVSYTLKNGRKDFSHRQFIVCQDIKEVSTILNSKDNSKIFKGVCGGVEKSLVFMFPGGGAQYPDMSLDLFEHEKVYKENINHCFDFLKTRFNIDLQSLLFPESDKLEIAQLALQKPLNSILSIFIIEWSLAKFWISKGLEPEAMIGHSMGEYVAACLSGVMSFEDALSLVVLRGKIFEKMPRGGMLSVTLSEEEIAKYLNNELNVGVVNGDELLVLSGTDSAIDEIEKRFSKEGIDCKRLKIDVAAHSKMLDPFLEEFRNGISEVKLNVPSIPFISNLSGNWIRNEEAVSPDYWVSQLRNSVRFAEGVGTLLKDTGRVFLEVGPGNTLSSLVRSNSNFQKTHSVVSSLRHPQEKVSDYKYFLTSLGKLWLAGVKINWKLLSPNEKCNRVPLPTYAFDRQSFWIEPGKVVKAQSVIDNPLKKIEDINEWFSKPVWKKSGLKNESHSDQISNGNSWLILNDNAGIGNLISAKLKGMNQRVIIVHSDQEFNQLNENEFTIRVDKKEDYKKLISRISTEKINLTKIIHLWGIGEMYESDLSQLEKFSDNLFYSQLFLTQALGENDIQGQIKWITITNGMYKISNEKLSYPIKALTLGPIKTIPKEFPGIKCVSLDFETIFEKSDLCDKILSEFNSEFTEQEVAIRNNHRYVRTIEPMELKSESKKDQLIVNSGVYILTGGVGGLSLTIARDIAKKFNPKLVFISRTELPEKSEWKNYISSHSVMDENAVKIRKLLEVEESGADILYFSADVTNSDRMALVFKDVYENYGSITGIIHTAGTIDDGVIMFKEKKDAASVLAPKVKGTLVLAELANQYRLNFLIMFSSASAILAPTGQIDYSAANSFIDAYANSKFDSDGLKTIAINWGQWQEVGMAARIAKSLGIIEESVQGNDTYHPLLGNKVVTESGGVEYHNKFNASKLWILSEHRDKNGKYIMPGTGYLEMVALSFSEMFPQSYFRLTDVFFLKPMNFSNREEKESRLLLSKISSGEYEFQILSRSNLSKSVWEENVRGAVSITQTKRNVSIDINSILNRCTSKFSKKGSPIEHHHMNFGPRWNNIKEYFFSENEALIHLKLPSEFTEDINDYKLHPALLDSATGYAQFLSGFDLENEFYLPFSYSEIVINNSLPDQFYSHIRFRPDESMSGKSIVFDISIFDTSGHIIIDIKNFIMIKSSSVDSFSDNKSNLKLHQDVVIEGSHNPINPKATGNKILQLGQQEGILPEEGITVFNKILDNPKFPQFIVVSQNINELADLLNKNENQNNNNEPGDPGESTRPKLSTEYLPPQNEIEQVIAEIWQDVLGVNEIGVNDDFLELGGHSLLLTRIVMRVRKKFSVDLSLNNLFEVPTISTFASEVKKAQTKGKNEEISIISSVSRDDYRVN